MEYSSRRQGLIAEAQGYDDLPMYIYYYRTSGSGREIIYTNEKGPHYYPWSQRIVMDEKKAKIFEYFLASEDEGKKEALRLEHELKNKIDQPIYVRYIYPFWKVPFVSTNEEL